MAYAPDPPPDQVSTEYILRELLRISAQFDLIIQGRFLEILSVAPAKPREGMLAIADGTNWNPGCGKGLYTYKDGAWVLAGEKPTNSAFFTYMRPAAHDRYIHMKTDFKPNPSSQMFSVRFEGYAFESSLPIAHTLVFYAYAIGPNIFNVGTAGPSACNAYLSSDGYAVMVLDVVSGYYTAFTAKQNVTAQGLRPLVVTAYTESTAATGVY